MSTLLSSRLFREDTTSLRAAIFDDSACHSGYTRETEFARSLSFVSSWKKLTLISILTILKSIHSVLQVQVVSTLIKLNLQLELHTFLLAQLLSVRMKEVSTKIKIEL